MCVCVCVFNYNIVHYMCHLLYTELRPLPGICCRHRPLSQHLSSPQPLPPDDTDHSHSPPDLASPSSRDHHTGPLSSSGRGTIRREQQRQLMAHSLQYPLHILSYHLKRTGAPLNQTHTRGSVLKSPLVWIVRVFLKFPAVLLQWWVWLTVE